MKLIRKTAFSLFMISFVLILSCEDSPTPTLERKVAERDSCLQIIDALNEKVKALNFEISELDTSISANKRKLYVNTMSLSRDTFIHYLQVQGIVEAEKNMLLSPEISGVVKQILVEEGQAVNKGQALLVLDNEIILKSIEELKIQQTLADDLFARQESLWNQKIGSEVQYLEAKVRKDGIDKSLKTAQTQLGKATINAPESGTVDEIFLKIGEMGSPMMPIIRIINLDKVYIKADVSEDHLNKVKKGQKVSVYFSSLGLSVPAEISVTGNFINPGNRTFKIQAQLNNKDGMLKPNLLGTILIQDFQKANAIAIPNNYIMSSADGEQYVYIADNSSGKSIAKKVIVKIGTYYDGKTLIEEGLNGDEILITEGARMVTNGESVIVKN